MGTQFTPRESRALMDMLARRPEDIVIRTDRDGFILRATPAIARLGFPSDAMLIGPHLLDLVAPQHRARAGRVIEAVIRRQTGGQSLEFPAARSGAAGDWYELQICAFAEPGCPAGGALGILRSIAERKRLEERIFTTGLTDPLTGLSNRRAFIAMLRHLAARRAGGCLAMFGIDHFRAINLRHGPSAGDRVLIAFSGLLRAMMRRQDIISRIGDERFAVLLPEGIPQAAGQVCRRIVETLRDTGREAGGQAIPVTASAGIARIGPSPDETMKRAELALILAKAKGGSRIETDRQAFSIPACGWMPPKATLRADTIRPSP